MKMRQEKPFLIDIPKHNDERGNLCVVDLKTCLPFDLKRVFYVFDIPAGVPRGAHAHKTLSQFIWSVSGSVKVNTLDRYMNRQEWVLSLPWQGLYLPPLTWASEKSLSAGCVYVVGASDYYDERDYIRDFDLFKKISTHSQNS